MGNVSFKSIARDLNGSKAILYKCLIILQNYEENEVSLTNKCEKELLLQIFQ